MTPAAPWGPPKKISNSSSRTSWKKFETQPGFENLAAPVNKEGAYYFLNQNSREPVTEPDEMVPLWKILHLAGADWTYGSKGWGGENYCMFLADDDSWKKLTTTMAKQTDELGCKTYLNTE